jgi:hypothetical protein
MADAINLATDTLTGDLRDRLLAGVKLWSEKPWQKQTAAEQRSIAQQIEHLCHELVVNMVDAIAADGHPVVRGTLIKVSAQHRLQLQVDVNKDADGRLNILDGIGATVMLRIADAKKYIGERAPVRIDADQPDLPAAAD